MVLQEERNLSNGGRRVRSGLLPKKHKANKIPQRGLGIAALEKLRREEQQSRISQSRIAAFFSTGNNITTTGGSVHFSASVISPAPFVPSLEQSTKPCCFGSSPLLLNSVQSVSSSNSNSRLPLLPRKLQEGQHRCSPVIRNFLSPPLSSGASLQREPPSNQSYVSINPPSMPVQKRSLAFQPCSALDPGNDPKRIAFSRLDASSSSCSRSNVRAEAEASKLDGSILSLSLLPVSEPSSMQTIPFHKHHVRNLQHIQKYTEENVSEAIDPPTLYNFMGLPHDLIESSLSEADTESKDEF